MPLITYSEANYVLDNTKVSFASELDALPEATHADTIVKAALYELYPDHVGQWDSSETPEATPALVKVIVALLMGAFRYEKKYSEEVAAAGRDAYSEILYRRAQELVKGLKEGRLSLWDTAYVTGVEFGSADFWPNATTGAIQEYDALGRPVGKVGDSERKIWSAERF